MSKDDEYALRNYIALPECSLSTSHNQEGNKTDALPTFALQDEFAHTIQKIHQSTYRVVRYLGRGAYGEVYSGYDLEGGRPKPVALKVIKTKRVPSKIGDMDRDVYNTLTKLKHRNIVSFYDHFQTNEMTCVSMQMCYGPDLQMYMTKYRYRPMEAKILIWSLLNGLSFMHSHNIIHNDLKLENVMYVRANPEYRGAEVHSEVVIVDFGFAQILTDGYAPNMYKGTPEYMPPEKLKRRDKLSDTKADMWALGVLSFIVYCGFFPYPFPTKTCQSEICKTIMHTEIDWPQRHELMITRDHEHRQAKAFIGNLLDKDAASRSTSDQALQHPWFDDLINVASLLSEEAPPQDSHEARDGHVKYIRNKIRYRRTCPGYHVPRRSPREDVQDVR